MSMLLTKDLYNLNDELIVLIDNYGTEMYIDKITSNDWNIYLHLSTVPTSSKLYRISDILYETNFFDQHPKGIILMYNNEKYKMYNAKYGKEVIMFEPYRRIKIGDE